MHLFGKRVPNEILFAAIAANANPNTHFGNGNDILLMYIIISNMKKPWEYDN